MDRPKGMQTDRDVLDIVCRRDFESFGALVFDHLNPGTIYLPNWHTKSLHYHLGDVGRGTYNRLIVAMPPRSGKSIAASVALPAFIHGHHPARRVICVSYAQELAVKLQNDYRKVLDSTWYRRMFPRTRIARRKDTESYVELTAGGTRVATSTGGTLTGLGADIIIIDDPLKASDAFSDAKRQSVNEWFGSSLLSRLDDKKAGAIIVVSQRLHMDDLIGNLLSTSTGWERLVLPAIASWNQKIWTGDNQFHWYRKGEVLHPERETAEMLENLRRNMGSDLFAAQYLQRPVPPGGNMFKRKWVLRYDHMPRPEPGDEILQSWDTASKEGLANDWSVCTTWLKRGGLFYLLDVFRERVDYPKLRSAAIRLAEQHRPRFVMIEDASVGTALISDLRRSGLNVRAIPARESKQVRAAVEAAKFEGGRVYFPNRAPWLRDFEDELFAFPGGKYDDQVDSMVHALTEGRPPVKMTTSTVKMY